MDRFLERMNRLVENVCALLTILLTIEIVYVAVMRRAFNNTPTWGEIIARLLLVYVCMIGYTIGVREDTHIRIDCFDRFLPKKVIAVLDWFTIVCFFVFSIFVVVEGVKLTMLCHKNVISGLGVPSSCMMICVPVGGALCFLQTISKIRKKP